MELWHLQVPKRLEIAEQRWFEGFVGYPDDMQSHLSIGIAYIFLEANLEIIYANCRFSS